MDQHELNSGMDGSEGGVSDAIKRFLRAPPDGTPREIVELFSTLQAGGFLPSKIFLETVEQAPVAISITDPSARILYVNRAFEELTGYLRSEVLGKNESVLSCRSTPHSVYQDLWQSIQERKVWRGRLVNHRKSEEEYLAELVISPVLDPQGAIGYYLGMHRDITSMHQLEQRLTYQKELTEAALDAVPQVVAIVGSDRNVLLDNHAYKALMGDFFGVEPAALFLQALEQQLDFEISRVCQAGQGFSNIEVRLDPPNGTEPRWFSCSGVRVSELDEAVQNYFKQERENRCCLLLTANEVTESRQRINESRLNMIRATMAEEQRVQTMREAILASIYKLQEPLNIIKAAMSMGSGGNRQPGMENGLGEVLQQALARGDEAMESLHSALPSPTLEQHAKVSVNEILHEVIRLSTDHLLTTGVVVDWRPMTLLPMVTGRANALRGIFKYLIDNAVQAVNEARRDQREICVQTRVEADELLVEVMDNGIGVTDSERLKLFEPFYCGWERHGDHAGMGLTMAREIAISHGGSVEVSDDFIGGCRVVVKLPLDGEEIA